MNFSICVSNAEKRSSLLASSAVAPLGFSVRLVDETALITVLEDVSSEEDCSKCFARFRRLSSVSEAYIPRYHFDLTAATSVGFL